MAVNQLEIFESLPARTNAGLIGGGGCYRDDNGFPVVVLGVAPHGFETGDNVELHVGEELTLDDERWRLSEVTNPGTSAWRAVLNRTNA
jgi:Family of unknown function (DUF6406)